MEIEFLEPLLRQIKIKHDFVHAREVGIFESRFLSTACNCFFLFSNTMNLMGMFGSYLALSKLNILIYFGQGNRFFNRLDFEGSRNISPLLKLPGVIALAGCYLNKDRV